MVAGASGIDAVLLVVAADEGVMPQTREHLEILRLLGVRDGLVALTKTDAVDEEFLELVLEDVREFVAGTFLEGRTIIPVSAAQGHNIELLRAELAALVDRIRPRPRKGPFFLPIDRIFPMPGFGTVVTGTAYRGELSAGSEGIVLPSGREGRIRSVQVHGAEAPVAWAGQRVAVSLAGVSGDEVSRGDVLCAKGIYAPTRCFECELQLLESVPELKHWQRVRLHIGTSDVTARISLLESSSLHGGDVTPAQIVTEEDVVCLLDQRFVLRRYSPLETIAGGRVLSPFATKPRGRNARSVSIERVRSLMKARTQPERLAALIESAGMLDLSDAVRFLQEPAEEVVRCGEKIAASGGEAVFLKGDKRMFLSRYNFERLSSAVQAFLRDFHAVHPSQRGAPSDEIALDVLKEFDVRSARAFLDLLAVRKIIVPEENFLRLADFTPRDDALFKSGSEALLALCRERGFQPPLLEDAARLLGMDEKQFSVLLKGMREMGQVAIVSGEFLLSFEIEERLLGLLLKEKEGITLARIRDLTNSSRKFILPLLEYIDAKGYTRRVGEVRVLLPSRIPSFRREEAPGDI
jgi:selenocysteine-specific elongation factor